MIKNKLSALGPTLTVAFAVKNGTAKLFAWPSKSAKTKADVRMRPTPFSDSLVPGFQVTV